MKSCIEYESSEDVDYGIVTHLNVTFIKDFGPWTKGTFCDELCLNVNDMVIIEYTADGREVKVQKIDFVCV